MEIEDERSLLRPGEPIPREVKQKISIVSIFALFGIVFLILMSLIYGETRKWNDKDDDSNDSASSSSSTSGSTSWPDGLTSSSSSFFNVHSKADDETAFYLEIPSSLISNGTCKTYFLFSAIFASGGMKESEQTSLNHMPAENTDEVIFEFHLSTDSQSIDLVRSNMYLRSSDKQSALTTMVSGWSGWLASLKVEATRTDGEFTRVNEEERDLSDVTTYSEFSYLVDASTLLKKGFFITSVQSLHVSSLKLRGGGDVGSSSAYVRNSTLREAGAREYEKYDSTSVGIRTFPLNIDVTVEYMLSSSASATSFTPEAFTFGIVKLWDKPMKGRVADERVGFFSTAYKEVGYAVGVKDLTSTASSFGGDVSDLVDRTVYLINRRYTDNGAEIIYHIDPSVPLRYRQSFKDGVERWQEAFQAVLGRDVIRAVLPGDSDFPSDYHAGDLRYNSISWSVGLEHTYAIGPSVVDLRSGEVFFVFLIICTSKNSPSIIHLFHK